MHKTEIKKLLIEHGLGGVASTKRVAEILGYSPFLITAMKNKGRLVQIDRNTYDIDSVVNWLHGHQRYLVRLAERPLPREEN